MIIILVVTHVIVVMNVKMKKIILLSIIVLISISTVIAVEPLMIQQIEDIKNENMNFKSEVCEYCEGEIVFCGFGCTLQTLYKTDMGYGAKHFGTYTFTAIESLGWGPGGQYHGKWVITTKKERFPGFFIIWFFNGNKFNECDLGPGSYDVIYDGGKRVTIQVPSIHFEPLEKKYFEVAKDGTLYQSGTLITDEMRLELLISNGGCPYSEKYQKGGQYPDGTCRYNRAGEPNQQGNLLPGQGTPLTYEDILDISGIPSNENGNGGLIDDLDLGFFTDDSLIPKIPNWILFASGIILLMLFKKK